MVGTSAARPAWRWPSSKGSDIMPWFVERLDEVLTKAVQPSLLVEGHLWCANTIRRCVTEANDAGRRQVRQNRRLLHTLHYLYEVAPDSPCGARLRENVLLSLLVLLGDDPASDERIAMDATLARELVEALQEGAARCVALAASLLCRRLSELPHVAQIVVLDGRILDALLSKMESASRREIGGPPGRAVEARITGNLLHTLVNVSGHPRLHFCLSRSRRLLHYCVETPLSVFRAPGTMEVARSISALFNSSTLTELHTTATETAAQAARPRSGERPVVSAELRRSVRRSPSEPLLQSSAALRAVDASKMLPCIMILSNLLSFPENRAEIRRLAPDLLLALGLCEAQEVSQKLHDAAVMAIGFIHEDYDRLESDLVTHLRPVDMFVE